MAASPRNRTGGPRLWRGGGHDAKLARGFLDNPARFPSPWTPTRAFHYDTKCNNGPAAVAVAVAAVEQGRRPMTSTEMIAIGAAAVSFCSMCAAIASAVFAGKNARIAEQAKEQSKKAATLEPRTKAINHIRQAHFDITNNGDVTGKTVTNIQEARNLASLVLGREVRTGLDRAYATASRLNVPTPLATQHSPDNIKLGEDLQTLITRMSDEAALVG
jgi:hypothetical protein